MWNDLRGVIRAREDYLRRTDVAFKDRHRGQGAKTQRCSLTEDALLETVQSGIYSRRQKGPRISFSSPFFRAAPHSRPRPREDRSLSGVGGGGARVVN